MSQVYDARAQQQFAAAVCRAIRESRRRQKLTQAEVANRTGGLVSKAALANYETGHRSLRIDVLWVIARALGEDLGGLLTMAERGIGRWPVPVTHQGAITVDVAEVMDGDDDRLAPVRRWFELRTGGGAASAMTLDDGAITALAALMGVTADECRRILSGAAGTTGQDDDAEPPAADGSVHGHGARVASG
ncbi:helix-turn-helix domain-containing protein [Nakamurella leprariae]|uniref:Helix-turn-helix transcriptional regulator n=1 Tax=Nakamurella leprariae TaxID=2803911 RepID=A0A938Y674_9ACTN|nr:helix-turn-helix transcriptional regulator [Nakamurella leprariae]MBM9466515.1 helix-turn-helix transcriptional regulator [Nakamurella leprariae]